MFLKQGIEDAQNFFGYARRRRSEERNVRRYLSTTATESNEAEPEKGKYMGN